MESVYTSVKMGCIAILFFLFWNTSIKCWPASSYQGPGFWWSHMQQLGGWMNHPCVQSAHNETPNQIKGSVIKVMRGWYLEGEYLLVWFRKWANPLAQETITFARARNGLHDLCTAFQLYKGVLSCQVSNVSNARTKDTLEVLRLTRK